MNYTMNRDRVVVSRTGRSYGFTKGVPLHVADMAAAEVMAAGGVPDEDTAVDEPLKPTAPTGSDREKLIIAAMKDMVVRGERNDFTASGAPQTSVLSNTLGFGIDANERNLAWAKAQNDD